MTVFHMTDDGPRPCRATKRACKYGATTHGEERDLQRQWERQQSESRQLPPVLTKQVVDSPSAIKAKRFLSDRTRFKSLYVDYAPTEKTVAMNVAREGTTSLTYEEIVDEDPFFTHEGMTSVRKVDFADGTQGYFKSLNDNTANEKFFKLYGTSSIEAMTNEVNAYRLAQAMGPGFQELVPETVIREYEGQLGSMQRGVETRVDLHLKSVEIDSKIASTLKLTNVRQAAIFDFVVGSLDRHSSNILVEDHEDGCRVRLIDNSFSFPSGPPSDVFRLLNESFLTEYADEIAGRPFGSFTEQERDGLKRAIHELENWVKNETITREKASEAISRANHLLGLDTIEIFENYLERN